MRVLTRLVPRWAIAAFAALALLSAGVALAAPAVRPALQPTTAGLGFDPLSDEEVARAAAAAGPLHSASAAAPRTAQVAPGQPALQAPAEETILIERHQESKDTMAAGAWPRRADIYVYRYSDDTLVHGLYNCATGQLDATEELHGVQLALTEAERDLAIQLAFADPALRAQMADEYRLITGDTLTDPAQVDIRVFTYHAGSNPELETPAAKACGVNRCAQLLILTADNVTFNVLPIINLSTLRVASVVPLAVEQSPAAPDSAPLDHH